MSMRRRVTAMAAVVALAALPAGAQAATPATISESVALGAGWLRAQQDPATGLVSGFGGDWSLSAMAAAGVNAADWRAPEPGAPSAQDAYLAEWTSSAWLAPVDPDNGWLSPDFRSASDFARATLLAHAAGLQPSRLSADQNLVAQLAAAWRGDGQYGSAGLNGAMFAMMALAQERVPQAVLDKTVALIRANRHDDGGWNYGLVTSPEAAASASDVDMTGAGVAALCAAGVPATDPDVQSALAFLRGKLEDSGGFTTPWFGTNADSNAWVVAGLNACGIDPQSPAWTTGSASTPLDFLVSLQRTSGANTGSFRWIPSEGEDDAPNLYATQDALRALAGGVFSATPPPREDPSLPAVRPAPQVDDGTSVPFALAIDAGGGDVRFCRVVAGTDSTIAEVLEAAQHTAQPTGCAEGLATDGGEVAALNGVTPAAGERWTATLDGGQPGRAGLQHACFGAVIALSVGADPGPADVVPCTSSPAPPPQPPTPPAPPVAPRSPRPRSPRPRHHRPPPSPSPSPIARPARAGTAGHVRRAGAPPHRVAAAAPGPHGPHPRAHRLPARGHRRVPRHRAGPGLGAPAPRRRVADGRPRPLPRRRRRHDGGQDPPLARRPGRRRRPGPPRAAPRGASAGPVRAPVGAPRGRAPAR
ncbi:MAG: prenyltransferase/squalene oxidase repeat-containing protein [Solirubrobacteraceae bacterium]